MTITEAENLKIGDIVSIKEANQVIYGKVTYIDHRVTYIKWDDGIEASYVHDDMNKITVEQLN